MDMELILYRAFLEAGLVAPKFRIEVPIGDDPNVARWFYDLVCTLASRLAKDELTASGIGELETLEFETRGRKDRGEIICRKRRARRRLVAKAWVTRRAGVTDRFLAPTARSRADLEGPLGVDLTRSPHRLAMTGICAFRSAGVDVKRT